MEYKWYIIKVSYGYEEHIRRLTTDSHCKFFKKIFIPFQSLYDAKSNTNGLREVYVYMHLCQNSKDILNQTPGFCSNTSSGSFEVISSDEMDLKIKEFNKYKWYILRVASNYEEKVCQHVLENSMRLGVREFFKEVFVPYEEPTETELRSKKTVMRKKSFPGYVFLHVNLNDEVLNFINNIPKSLKVYGFLKDSGAPKEISSDEIRSMCNALYDAQETKKLNNGYEKGERVRINDGLFQNFTGKVDTVNDEKKIINVEVSILGKPTVIELELSQVEKIEE